MDAILVLRLDKEWLFLNIPAVVDSRSHFHPPLATIENSSPNDSNPLGTVPYS